MERPALQRLLGDIGEGRIDVVVLYKVDRLTRSLADFANMVELFDARGVGCGGGRWMGEPQAQSAPILKRTEFSSRGENARSD
jgi:Resolvase, N terminal domain